MASFYSDEEINKLRESADIATVISRYLPIQKKGKSYKAICPFHDDHDPSLTINIDLQIYKCFVCGAGGNVFSFVQNYEKIDFPEAVETVAKIVGFELSTSHVSTKKEIDPHKAELYKIFDETIRYSMYELNSTSATLEREYLDKRGLTSEIREKFQIGFNPYQDSVYRFLKEKGYKDEDIVSTNIARITESGIHDVFTGRITFPIHDASGNPIGFSARSINPNNESKYINTTDTELFNKGNIVFNYHRAKPEARRQGKIYLTEGVTDVIAFARAGIMNCVCTLGTACTQEQLKLLKNASPKLVFCYDGDTAGQRATYKAGQLAKSLGISIGVIKNETGLDPDEILRKEGSQGLQDLCNKEISWIEFVIQYFKNQVNFDNYEEKKEFVKKVVPEIQSLQDEMDRKYFLSEISKMTGFDVQSEFMKAPIPKQTKNAKVTLSKTQSGIENAEEMILTMMLKDRAAISRFEQKLGYLTIDSNNRLAITIVDLSRKKNEIDIGTLIDESIDQEEKNLITKLATSWLYELPYDEKEMDGAIRKVLKEQKIRQRDAFRQQLSQPMNEESRKLLMNEYLECNRDLRRYIDEDSNEQS